MLTDTRSITIHPDYATFAVSQHQHGSARMHRREADLHVSARLVTLIFENGRWVVEDL